MITIFFWFSEQPIWFYFRSQLVILRQNHTFIQENRATTKIVFFRRKKSKKYSYFFYGASYAKSDFVFGLAMLFWVRFILQFKKKPMSTKIAIFIRITEKNSIKSQKNGYFASTQNMRKWICCSVFFFSTRWRKNHFCCNLFRVDLFLELIFLY